MGLSRHGGCPKKSSLPLMDFQRRQTRVEPRHASPWPHMAISVRNVILKSWDGMDFQILRHLRVWLLGAASRSRHPRFCGGCPPAYCILAMIWPCLTIHRYQERPIKTTKRDVFFPTPVLELFCKLTKADIPNPASFWFRFFLNHLLLFSNFRNLKGHCVVKCREM